MNELKTKLTGGIMEIPTALIQPDPAQPRKEFTPEAIENLAESIKSEGLLQPITVRRNPELPGAYLIIAGERRWRAHCVAGMQAVRCIVSMTHDDQRRRFRAQVMENTGRKDMTFKEEADAIVKLKAWGDSDEEIGHAIGMSPYRVKNIFELTKVSANIWKLLMAGAINREVAEYVAGNVMPADVEQLLMRGVGKGKKAFAAIVDAYEDERRQETFELASDERGSVAKKREIEKGLACQLLEIASAIDKLPAGKRRVLARKMGKEVAALTGNTKRIRAAAVFLSAVFNQVDAVSE
jgi:ParB/RepB/Spo0J family partition protein